MSMNNFGCTAADVIAKLTAGAYLPTTAELGGATAVTDAITTAADQIIQAMPEEVFRQLTRVDLNIVQNRATAGATTTTLPMVPVQPGKTYVWAAQPRFFINRPWKSTELLTDDEFFDPSSARILAELVEGTAYTIVPTTGIITWTGRPLVANDMVLASYEVDTEAATYSVQSLKNTAANGAAASLASRLYPRESTQWAYLDTLVEDFTKKLTALQAKEWIPPELRKLQFWKPLIPKGEANSRIQVGRVVRG